MQHEGQRVRVRRRPSSRRSDVLFTCFHKMTRSRFPLACDDTLFLWSLRFRRYPAIFGVRELIGISLTSIIFLAECRFIDKLSPTTKAVGNGCLVYEQQGQ